MTVHFLQKELKNITIKVNFEVTVSSNYKKCKKESNFDIYKIMELKNRFIFNKDINNNIHTKNGI